MYDASRTDEEVVTLSISNNESRETLLAVSFDDQRVVVGTDPVTLGSSTRAACVLADPAVSAVHCELLVAKGRLAVRDLGSRNGVYANGVRVKEGLLEIGGRLTIGTTSGTVVPMRRDDEEGTGSEPLPEVAGRSEAMRTLASRVRRFAAYRAPVLISGETGVGKEKIARALHDEGPRQKRPFVVINVAALPRELIESELFGHERGAFTGAVSRKRGAFEEADGGTLFLDEIGELPLDAQPKLLRALDGYEVRTVGAEGSGRKRDVRIVAATHVDLADRVREGRFRRDLYHRLEVFTLAIPPLRDRREDIPAIAKLLLRELAREVGPRMLSPQALEALSQMDWHGNVRELRNIVFRAADLATGSIIEPVHLIRASGAHTNGEVKLSRKAAEQALAECRGNVSEAARLVGLPRTSYRRVLVAEQGSETEKAK